MLAPCQVRLEADKVINRAVGVIPTELYNGVVFLARSRVTQADRLQRAEAQCFLAPACHDLNWHTAFKHAAVVKAVDRRFLCRNKLFYERLVLLLVHRAVYIIRRALIVAGGEKRTVHIDALKRHDGCDGIVKVQSRAVAKLL